MLQAAHAGKIDLVAAVALDRYARSVRELLDLAEKLGSWDVDLVSLRESIDTSTAVGKMTFTVLAAVAEFERELIRERTSAGLDEARRAARRSDAARRTLTLIASPSCARRARPGRRSPTGSGCRRAPNGATFARHS